MVSGSWGQGHCRHATGSTAYSMSAGAHREPNCRCIVVTPVCALPAQLRPWCWMPAGGSPCRCPGSRKHLYLSVDGAR
ncbi:MAG: hypothetical protein ACLSUM_13125 [Dysosmobacter welbionis]